VADPSFEVRVDPSVHAVYPDYVALVLLASNLTNGPSDAASDAQLAEVEAHLHASGLQRATDHPHIAAWRAAFSAFGAKLSRYPSSAESLITRVLKGQPLPRVNALVDLYNAISVRHVVPLGGEDADRLEGPLHLTTTAGGEIFDPSQRRHRQRTRSGRRDRLARRPRYVAQPGLSSQIRRLEAELGITLFARHTRGVDLTDAGELLLERARTVLAAADDALATGRDLQAGLVGSIRLGLAAEAPAAVTPGLLAAFGRDHPDVEVVAITSYTGALLRSCATDISTP
jgi:hypothetical protein